MIVRHTQSSDAATTTSTTTPPTPLLRDRDEILTHVKQVHSPDYLKKLQEICEETDRPKRLDPRFARTFIDHDSYQAALGCCAQWMNAVDSAVAASASSSSPQFALTRPPSHHATKSKGMGGCLLNSVAVAACYALSLKNIKNVAILDLDAHHGNGIANCIETMPNVRFVSIHEDARKNKWFAAPKVQTDEDPRSSEADDQGPLGNILNINLSPGTTWENGYRDALVKEALPFLMGDRSSNNASQQVRPDLILVAAGMDAMAAGSSGLELLPSDYREIGRILKQEFGSSVAFGLEGGYAYKKEELGQAIYELVQPWTE